MATREGIAAAARSLGAGDFVADFEGARILEIFLGDHRIEHRDIGDVEGAGREWNRQAGDAKVIQEGFGEDRAKHGAEGVGHLDDGLLVVVLNGTCFLGWGAVPRRVDHDLQVALDQFGVGFADHVKLREQFDRARGMRLHGVKTEQQGDGGCRSTHGTGPAPKHSLHATRPLLTGLSVKGEL